MLEAVCGVVEEVGPKVGAFLFIAIGIKTTKLLAA
jgi:hypothetical protein